MTYPEDNLFDTGLCALCAALGVGAGLFLGGHAGPIMYGAMASIGCGLLGAGIALRDLRHRRHMKDWRIIKANLPQVGVEVVKHQLRGLVDAGRET
jgi:hypothetical protein